MITLDQSVRIGSITPGRSSASPQPQVSFYPFRIAIGHTRLTAFIGTLHKLGSQLNSCVSNYFKATELNH